MWVECYFNEEMSFQLLQFLSQNGFSLCALQKRSEPRFRIQVERRTNHPRPRTYARTAWGMKWQMRALTHAPPRTLQSLVIPLAVSSLVLSLHSDKVSLFVPAFFRFVLGFKNTLVDFLRRKRGHYSLLLRYCSVWDTNLFS